MAEEGQVVLLDTHMNSQDSSFCAKTEVIPDAAGYEIDIDTSNYSKELRECFLKREIMKYKVGINQVERGVKSVHTATGYGWDISYTPGHPVNILHTGSEPIHRFDFIGVRFPNEQDVTAQVETWNTSKPGTSVSHFATYPIMETWELTKFERFKNELFILSEEAERGYSGVDVTNPSLEYMQLPALTRRVDTVQNYIEEDKIQYLMKELTETDEDVRKAKILTSESGIKTLLDIALAATKFTETLRPPFVIAQVLDFQCVQPQLKSNAECGDVMRCVML